MDQMYFLCMNLVCVTSVLRYVCIYQSKAAVCSIASPFSISRRCGFSFSIMLFLFVSLAFVHFSPILIVSLSAYAVRPTVLRMQLSFAFVSHSSYIHFAIQIELIFFFPFFSSLFLGFLCSFPFHINPMYMFFYAVYIRHFLGHNSLSMYHRSFGLTG